MSIVGEIMLKIMVGTVQIMVRGEIWTFLRCADSYGDRIITGGEEVVQMEIASGWPTLTRVVSIVILSTKKMAKFFKCEF